MIAQGLKFSDGENLAKLKLVTPIGDVKCRWGTLNAGEGDLQHEALRSWLGRKFITLSVIVCSTFAVIQRVTWVCRRQLILVNAGSPMKTMFLE